MPKGVPRSGRRVNPRDWTEDELTIIRENPELTCKQLTEFLPRRSAKAINCQRSLLGLKRTPRAPLPKKQNSWPEEELEILRANIELTSRELTNLLPGRSAQAIGNMRTKFQDTERIPDDVPPVKAPGEYLVVLSGYFVDDFECMTIWLKWNGYASCRELFRDERDWATLLCTAK